MKTRAMLALAIGAASLSCSTNSREPIVVGHIDGAQRIAVTLRLVDEDSHTPIPGVDVTFFGSRDLEKQALIDAQRDYGIEPTVVPPDGVRGVTDQTGRVTIDCWFDAAFPMAYQSGREVEVPADIFPVGDFAFFAVGFEPMRCRARQIFPGAVYDPEGVKVEQTIAMKRAQPGATDNPGDAQ